MTMRTSLGAELVSLNTIMADQAGFRDWYELALPRVYRYLLARCGGDADLAEELTQQTFVEGVRRRLVILVLQDPEPMLWGGEPILRNGHAVGYTTSGGYGHTLGASVAIGYVRNDAGIDQYIKRFQSHLFTDLTVVQ